MNIKVLASNRKARFEYFLLDSFEAGIVLKGSEIKSIRAGQVSLVESYVQVDGKQAWLVNAHVAPYNPSSRFNHDPKRARKLLLHKKEIKQLFNAIKQKGVTIIPVKIYLKDGKAKLEISIAKGKKLYDKREDIAKRDMERELSRRVRKS